MKLQYKIVEEKCNDLIIEFDHEIDGIDDLTKEIERVKGIDIIINVSRYMIVVRRSTFFNAKEIAIGIVMVIDKIIYPSKPS